jgi:hypothetical protein
MSRKTPVFHGPQPQIGAFSGDVFRMNFAAAKSDLLSNKLDFQYSQHVRWIYCVGNPTVYRVAGPAVGEVAVAQIIGAHAALFQFVDRFTKSDRPNLSLHAARIGRQFPKFDQIEIKDCVLTAVGASVSSHSTGIQIASTLNYGDLNVT